MAEATATSQQATEDTSALDAVLSSDLIEPSTEAQTSSDQAAGGEVGSGEQAAETATEEVAGETAEPSDESAIYPREEETDYSDAAYARAAEHYSKTLKAQFDPTNPKDKAVLRELLQRGQRIQELQQAAEATPQQTEEEPGAEKATEEAAAEPPKETPEQVQQFIQSVERYAETLVRPEVATKFATDFARTLFPGQFKEGQQVAPEMARSFAKVMTTFGLLFLNDVLPQVMPGQVSAHLSNQYPYLGRVHEDAVRAEAIESLLAETHAATKQPVYGDLEELIDNGTLNRVFAQNAWIREGKYTDAKGKPLAPVDNAKRQIEIAVKLARGERVSPQLIKKAVATGKEQAKAAQKTAGSGRLAAGESKGAFQQDTGDPLLKDILAGGESRWAKGIEQREKGS